MEPQTIRSWLLRFPEVTESTPFDETTVVFKTAGKLFALVDWDEKPLRFNLKCDPAKVEQLRDRYACVLPGYHMNKKHWNTVVYDGSVDDAMFLEWVEHSFYRVVQGLPKAKQKELLARWDATKLAG
jgi:predicted DNA-binding protein (MmcQ/YjbR family)